MELATIKHAIENNENLPSSIIFNCTENAFIPESYIDHLRTRFKISYIQSLDYIVNLKNDIFSEYPKDTLFIYKTDMLDSINPIISEVDNLIIICYNIDKSIIESYSNYIVTVPKLESWQIEDYIKSVLPHT